MMDMAQDQNWSLCNKTVVGVVTALSPTITEHIDNECARCQQCFISVVTRATFL